MSGQFDGLNDGMRFCFDYVVGNGVTYDTPRCRLYTNFVDVTNESLKAEDFDECESEGYEEISLWINTWSNVEGVSVSYPEVTFNIVGVDTIYGAMITNNSGSKILWAQTDGSYPITTPDSISITPEASIA